MKGAKHYEDQPDIIAKKYARVVSLFAEEEELSLDEALSVFYHSDLYELMREGCSDMHCMSDQYLLRELSEEYRWK